MKKLMLLSRDHPLIVLCFLAVITLFFAYHAGNIAIDSSTKNLTITNDPVKLMYTKTLETFGSDNVAMVYIKDEHLFSYEKLTAIEEVFYNLQDIPGVVQVNGLFNATNFKGEDGFLLTDAFLGWVPQDAETLVQIRQDALQNPMVNSLFIATDVNAIAISVILEPYPDEANFNFRVADDIDAAIAPLENQVEQIFQIGIPYTERFIAKTIIRDIVLLTPFGIIIVFVVLMFGIRTIRSAFAPVITAGISIIWTLGFMAIFDIPIDLLSWMFPFLVIIIGATEDMHLISEYLEALQQGMKKKDAITYMAEKNGLAVMLTGLTTFLGFLAVTINKIAAMKHFGAAAAFALLVNPFITFVVIPIYLRYFGEERVRQSAGNSNKQGFLGKVEEKLIYLVNKRGRWVLAGLIVIIPFLVWGAASLNVDNDLFSVFKPGSELRVRAQQMHTELSGVQNFYLVLNAHRKGAFQESNNLHTVFAIQEFIQQKSVFDRSFSIANYVALLNREMFDGDPGYYRIPDQDDLVSQYALFLDPLEIERYVSSDWSQVNIHVHHNITSSFELKAALRELEAFVRQNVEEGWAIDMTGEQILFHHAVDSITSGQIYSLSLIVGCIFIILSILFVRLKAGVLALVPNLVPILFLFGVMGLLNVPLNTATALVAAITIGIAVDDTIHLFVRYNREMKRTDDQKLAIARTLHGDLRPVLTTSIALAMGFGILGFSNSVLVVQSSLLSAMVLIVALFADMLVTPILLASTKLVTVWDLLGVHLKKNVVTRSELFRDMRQLQIKKVALLGHIADVQADDYIIRQGERERNMYMILEGAAHVELEAENGERVKLKQLAEGEIFGEIALLNEVERTAHVIADSPTKVLSIDWDSLERIRKIFPRISTRFFLNIARILGMKLASTSKKVRID